MHATKVLSLLPCLIAVCTAADCYNGGAGWGVVSNARTALQNLYYNGNYRRCVSSGGCKACYRTGGPPARFNEAVGNIRDQCIGGNNAQGYWEADGLRVCYDCVNSGNCNDISM